MTHYRIINQPLQALPVWPVADPCRQWHITTTCSCCCINAGLVNSGVGMTDVC